MKKPELTATSVEKFLIEKFDSVSDLMQLSEGEESRAFSFDVGGRGYVLRVNSCADGFYKDRYVYRHFASAALPIPEVLDIGEFSESLTCLKPNCPLFCSRSRRPWMRSLRPILARRAGSAHSDRKESVNTLHGVISYARLLIPMCITGKL